MIDRTVPPASGRFTRARFAHFLLALVTGLPLHSASAIVPTPDDESGPFVGI